MEDLHVVELEDADLADDPGVGLDAADERAERATDVSRDRNRASAGAQDLPEERRGGRLPVRSGDGEDRVRQEPRAELELVPDGNAARASARDQRRVARDPGLFTTRSIPCSSVSSSPPRWTSTPSARSLPASSISFESKPTTVAPRMQERLRGSRSGPCETDDEDAPAGELAHITRAGRTAGSRGRRAQTRRRRRSRRRSRSAP